MNNYSHLTINQLNKQEISVKIKAHYQVDPLDV
jgi:hypothetical protein